MDINNTLNGGNRNNTVKLMNPHVQQLQEDHLYHIALSSAHALEETFGDVKFVCFGGQPSRMAKFAQYVAGQLGLKCEDSEPRNYAEKTDRYAVYKAGPVLAVSHGIGIPSLSIIFQEIIKLLHYAKCTDVLFFRLGTSGGLGLPPGSVVVSDKVVNGAMQSSYKVIVLGKAIDRPAVVDSDLARELQSCTESADDFKTILGTTLCADDFYEGQGRIDGAFCDHDNQDKVDWLKLLGEKGVVNMEMESLGFIAMCHRAGVRGAVVCVTLIDRFEGDNITTDVQALKKWQTHPQLVVCRFIRKMLSR